MLITYHGHSQFTLETASGVRILTDPYDAKTGYPLREVAADIVTVSHAHDDHAWLQKVTGQPLVIRDEGPHTPQSGIRIQGFPAWHDDAHGQKRGRVLCYVIQADGLRVVHLGDLGELPPPALAEELGTPDVLLIPVGGFYTIDAAQAAQAVEQLNPRMVIPMHYRNQQGGYEVINTVDVFARLMVRRAPTHQPLVRVTREDISQQPRCVILDIAP